VTGIPVTVTGSYRLTRNPARMEKPLIKLVTKLVTVTG